MHCAIDHRSGSGCQANSASLSPVTNALDVGRQLLELPPEVIDFRRQRKRAPRVGGGHHL